MRRTCRRIVRPGARAGTCRRTSGNAKLLAKLLQDRPNAACECDASTTGRSAEATKQKGQRASLVGPCAFFCGAPGRIRTSDPQVRSLVLYPAELRARGRSGIVPNLRRLRQSNAGDAVWTWNWRRLRDSNPRWSFWPHTPLAGEPLQPLGQVSGTSASLRGASDDRRRRIPESRPARQISRCRCRLPVRARPRRCGGCAGRSPRGARPRPWAR